MQKYTVLNDPDVVNHRYRFIFLYFYIYYLLCWTFNWNIYII